MHKNNQSGGWRASNKHSLPDMSNVIEGAIDIDFLEVLTLTIDIQLTIFE